MEVPEITPETAREDIRKVMMTFDSIGPGNERDRAAQLVLQSVEILMRRLDKPRVLEILYTDEEAVRLLPESIKQVVQDLIKGEITPDAASERLAKILQLYREVFKEMGFIPQVSQALLFKQ